MRIFGKSSAANLGNLLKKESPLSNLQIFLVKISQTAQNSPKSSRFL